MPAAANDERFRRMCVDIRGRLRVGSYDHASAWRLPYDCFRWCLDAGRQRRRVRPGARPWTWKGRTTRASRSTGSATSHGPSGGAASHGASRAGRPTASHAAATGDGAAAGAPHRLTAAASVPTFQRPASRPPGGGAKARIPSGAGSAATSGHGAAADTAYRSPFSPKCTPGRERGIGTATRDAFAPIRGTPGPHRPLAATRAAIAIAEAGRRKGAAPAATVVAVAEPPS